MPLQRMPNGEFVEIADGTPPEVVAKIAAQFKPEPARAQTRVQRREAGQPRRSGGSLADDLKRLPGGGSDATDQFLSTATFGASDVIRNAAQALGTTAVRALEGKGYSSPIENYKALSKFNREEGERYERANPLTAAAAQAGGAILNPVGTGEQGALAVGRAATRLAGQGGRAAPALASVGNAATKAGEFIGRRGAIGSGIIAGANQGALQSAAQSENFADVPENLIRGGVVGGALGGGIGAAGQAIAKGGQIIADRLPKNTMRRAYGRVGSMLDDAKLQPNEVRNEIIRTDLNGGNAVVADMDSGLQAYARQLSKRPGLSASRDIRAVTQERLDGRAARYTDAVENNAAATANRDAMSRMDDLQAARTGAGSDLYAKGGVMDKPLNWSSTLQKLSDDSPDIGRLMPRALVNAQRMGDDLGRIEGTQAIPSMRVFDYLKREFDDEIGGAIKAGNNTKAKGLSNHLKMLKGELIAQNPEYAPILNTMRDAFQKEAALATGTKVLDGLKSNPRQLLRDFNKLSKEEKEEWRIGVIDALMQQVSKSKNPAAFVSERLSTVKQREVMQEAFGTEFRLASFERWAKREARGTSTDTAILGPQSPTAGDLNAAAELDGTGAGSVGVDTARGFAFGGAIGAATGMWRSLKNLAVRDPRAVQEEIAKILVGKGEGLQEGVSKAKDFATRRAARDKSRAVNVAKAGQQPFAGEANTRD